MPRGQGSHCTYRVTPLVVRSHPPGSRSRRGSPSQERGGGSQHQGAIPGGWKGGGSPHQQEMPEAGGSRYLT
jgi:hypothetical protein